MQVSGEDLTPYRRQSRAIWDVLLPYGTVQKGGLDEAFLDATAEVKKRFERGEYAPGVYCGHVHIAGQALGQDSIHRPQDLRILHPVFASAQVVRRDQPTPAAEVRHGSSSSTFAANSIRCSNTGGVVDALHDSCSCPDGTDDGGVSVGVCRGGSMAPPCIQESDMHDGVGSEFCDEDFSEQRGGDIDQGQLQATVAADGQIPWPILLQIGSQVAAEIRASIFKNVGFRTSAGIACNKLLAKLCSGLHKPNDQTVLTPVCAAGFVLPLPVRTIPGMLLQPFLAMF